ncbi:MAG: alpha/beta hydrolase-fold protein [Proteobacteria bacterium]|nr:alpha/beta hydrolase-fold protein [Pseudomonadota bacterium]
MIQFIVRLLSLFMILESQLLAAETYTLGASRPAVLLTPNQINPDAKIPLIVFLHGYTSNSQQADTYFGVSRQRDRLGFAVLLPDGTKNSKGDRFWNATPECCDFEKSGVEDSAYLAALIREAELTAPIDPDRVIIMGHSNGGFMSYRLLCDYPELIWGIVPISGVFFKSAELCKNPQARTILQIHGLDDKTVPFEGNSSFPSVLQSLDYWIHKGNCLDIEVKDHAFDLNQDLIRNEAAYETDSITWKHCLASQKIGLWKMNGIDHIPYFTEDWLKNVLDFMQ